LVQNILNIEQIIDDSKALTIVPKKGFWPLILYYDPYWKEYNFQTLFYGIPRPYFMCSYKKIIQTKLTSANRKFAPKF